MFSFLGAKKKLSDVESYSSNDFSSNLNFDDIDFSLNTLYEAYIELCHIGYANKISSIVLYYIPHGDICIDVLLDGSYFLKGMKNDILTAFYELPEGEDPNTFHFRRARIISKPVTNKELNLYLNSYKQRNSDKSDFLELIKIN